MLMKVLLCMMLLSIADVDVVASVDVIVYD